MIKELVKDEAILSQRCEKATAEDADVVQDLVDTMESIEDCACLAANQIGVTKAIGVYLDEKHEPHAVFNPRVMMGLGAQKVFEECMTRDEPSKVTRYAMFKISYDELVDGELQAKKRDFTGWAAQMIQHMCDHCQGKLV